MHAIVLAAGAGRRLRPWTDDRPKVLVEIGTESIFARMLRQLVAVGVTDITVVIGDRGHQVRAAAERARLPLSFTWVDNHDFATTNNSWSLCLAADTLRKGALLIEGDVVTDVLILRSLTQAAPPTCWLVRPYAPGMDGALLQSDARGALTHLEIVRSPATGRPGTWKSMGLLRVSPAFGARLAGWLESECRDRRDRYYDLVIAEHLSEEAPTLVAVNFGFWSEIDTPADLDRAARALGFIA